MEKPRPAHEEFFFFVALAALGTAASFLKVEIPNTHVFIEGSWVFGFIGFAFLRHWWTALLLAGVLAVPRGPDIGFVVGFSGNMAYALPSLLTIRFTHRRFLLRLPLTWAYALGWFFLIMVCYQLFTTPAVWATLAIIDNAPIADSLLTAWKTQPFLVESLIVGIVTSSIATTLRNTALLRQSKERLEHINRILLAIRHINDLIVTEDDSGQLIQMAATGFTDAMGYRAAWLGLLDDSGHSLTHTAASGPPDLVDQLRTRLEPAELPDFIKTVITMPSAPLLDEPGEETADICLPVQVPGHVILAQRMSFGGHAYGLFVVVMPALFARDAEEQGLLGEIAGDLAFALCRIASGQTLVEVEARYRTLFDRALNPIFIVSDKGAYIGANDAALAFLETSRQELFKKSVWDYTPPEKLEKQKQEHSPFLEPKTIETDYNVNGKRKTLLLNVVPLPSGDRTILFGVGQDITAQKRLQEEMAARDALFTKVFAQVPGVLYQYCSWPDGRVALPFISEGSRELFGATPAEWEDDASPLYDRVHPEDLSILDESIRKTEAAVRDPAGTGRAPWHCEYRYQVPGHPTKWVMGRSVAELQPDGRVYWYGFTTDITDIKNAEATLRESEERYRKLYENAPIGIFSTDSTGKVLAVNSTMAQMLDLATPDEAVAHFTNLGEQLYTQPHRRIEFLDRLQQHGYVKDFEYEARTADGRIIWLSMNARLVRNSTTGEFVIEGFTTEITKRRRAEAERERLMAAIEQAGEAIVITDAEATIQYVNPAFEQITGYRPDEAIGQNPRILKSDEQDDAFYQAMWQTLAAGQTWQGRFVNRRKDGSLYTEVATISPVRDALGVTTNYVAVKSDITEQLTLEQQYYQSQKMESVGRLAGGIAHDFNNMLNVILGNAELALEDIPPDSPLRTDLVEIQAAARRSADLTRQLLAFARKQTVAPQTLDLNATVAGMLKILRRLIGENIELVWLPGGQLWPVKIDPSQVDQLLANLCVNARDAIDGTGTITIETANITLDEAHCAEHPDASPGDFATLSIHDTGCGMDAQTVEHLFEPFFTTKTVGQGTGLGLATVYGIVRQNQGFIDIDSEPGRGTTFRICLPRQHLESGNQTATQLGDSLPRGHETILLVEDEPALLRIGQSMLQRLGYHVLVAPTPAEGMAVAERHTGTIDLLMTDVVMPEMNGRELADRILATHPDIKLLFMSGYTADVIAHHGVLDEDTHFLEKPFSEDSLAAKVREALDADTTTA